MKLSKISIYQAVEIPGDKKINMNTISSEIIPGVLMELDNHIVTVSHKDWGDDVLIPTTNIRYATTSKKIVKTFSPEKTTIEVKTSTPVSKSHSSKTKKSK